MYHLMNCSKKRIIQTCNFSQLEGGTLHPDRTLDGTHDLLYVLEGGWEVVDGDVTHQLFADDLLFLHAGRHHFGKTGCLPNTLTMFIHCERMGDDSIVSQNKVQGWEDAVLIDSVTHCQNSPHIKELFKSIIYHFFSGTPFIQIKLSALLTDLLFELSALSSLRITGPAEDKVVTDIIYKIRTSPQISYTVQALADEYYVCPSTLNKRFKQAAGTTIYQYQLNAKMEMACLRLVNEQDIPLKEIAFSYGFCDEFHFSKLFKKKYGMPPSHYKKLVQSAAGGTYNHSLCGGQMPTF